MLNALDISTSALVAQRVRMNAISSNLANMSSHRNENGEMKPYQARYVIFEVDDDLKTKHGAAGVKVAEVKTEDLEPVYKHAPGHPLAIREGKYKDYVATPPINMTSQFVDALEASRAYEANIGAMEISKSMGRESLRIIA